LFYEDGTTAKYIGDYKKGIQEGKGVSYTDKGEIIHEGEFKNGEPVKNDEKKQADSDL